MGQKISKDITNGEDDIFEEEGSRNQGMNQILKLVDEKDVEEEGEEEEDEKPKKKNRTEQKKKKNEFPKLKSKDFNFYLPPEILLNIANFTCWTIKDARIFSEISRIFHEVLEHYGIWKRIYEDRWPGDLEKFWKEDKSGRFQVLERVSKELPPLKWTILYDNEGFLVDDDDEDRITLTKELHPKNNIFSDPKLLKKMTTIHNIFGSQGEDTAYTMSEIITPLPGEFKRFYFAEDGDNGESIAEAYNHMLYLINPKTRKIRPMQVPYCCSSAYELHIFRLEEMTKEEQKYSKKMGKRSALTDRLSRYLYQYSMDGFFSEESPFGNRNFQLVLEAVLLFNQRDDGDGDHWSCHEEDYEEKLTRIHFLKQETKLEELMAEKVHNWVNYEEVVKPGRKERKEFQFPILKRSYSDDDVVYEKKMLCTWDGGKGGCVGYVTMKLFSEKVFLISFVPEFVLKTGDDDD